MVVMTESEESERAENMMIDYVLYSHYVLLWFCSEILT